MKKIRSRLDILWVAMLMTSLLISFFSSNKLATISWADGDATVSIVPDPQGVLLGDTATTDVRVENVTDLYGFEFQITFDQTLVEVDQIQPGDFLSPDWELDSTIDNDNGTIDYALCQKSPNLPKSGSGVLATITWRGKAVGTSLITITHLLLGAPGGVEIPASAEHGQITVGEGFTVTFVSATYDPGTNQTTFTYRVSADGGQGSGVSMSHWELETCTPYYVDGSGSGTGYDPHARVAAGITYSQVETGTWTGTPTIQGIKWGDARNSAGQADPLGDENAAETDVFTYALQGNWENSLSDFLAFRLKFGTGIDPITGLIRGPDCGVGPTAITLSSFTAQPSAGLEASLVWPWLVGVATLAMGGTLWVRRRERTRGSSN